jgi:hypothetical protein
MRRFWRQVLLWIWAVYGALCVAIDSVSRAEWVRDKYPALREFAVSAYPYLGQPPWWATWLLIATGFAALYWEARRSHERMVKPSSDALGEQPPTAIPDPARPKTIDEITTADLTRTLIEGLGGWADESRKQAQQLRAERGEREVQKQFDAVRKASPPPDPRLAEIDDLNAKAFAIIEKMFRRNCVTDVQAAAVNTAAEVMIAQCADWVSKHAVHMLPEIAAAKTYGSESNFRYGRNLIEQEHNPTIHFDCLANHMILRECMTALSQFRHQLTRFSVPKERE